MAFFVDEYQDLHDLIVAGKYPEALTLLGELDEMSREDKFDKIGSFMDVLLIHLIKRAEDPRSTRPWEVSIQNAVDRIRRTNRNRNTRSIPVRSGTAASRVLCRRSMAPGDPSCGARGERRTVHGRGVGAMGRSRRDPGTGDGPHRERINMTKPKSAMEVRFGGRLDDRLFTLLCRENHDLRLERTGLGELVIMTPAGAESGWRESRLNQRLANWNDAAGLGVCSSSAGFKLPDGAIRSPDASWIPNERWDRLPLRSEARLRPAVPRFRGVPRPISCVHSCARLASTEPTAPGWAGSSTRSGKVVEVYRPGRETEVLKDPEGISGGDVLPGFVLDLKDILEDA